MKSAKSKMIALCAMLCIVFLLTACGSGEVAVVEQTEKAKVSMDSVAKQITEPGIIGYESSEKSSSAYDTATWRGDFGTIILTLLNGDEPYFYTAPWWTGESIQKYATDTIVVAGKIGSIYKGTVECHKCGYFDNIEGEVYAATDIKRFSCECEGVNASYGMKKKVTFVIVPFYEPEIEAEKPTITDKNAETTQATENVDTEPETGLGK